MITVRTEHSRELENLFNSPISEIRRQGHILLGRAINRAATAGRTRASIRIREKYVIKAGDIKKSIKMRKASVNRLAAEIRASGPLTPLMKFDVTPTFPDHMIVRARVKKGGKKAVDNGFVARTGNGHVNVFTRVGASRLPIKGRYGPSVAQMMGNDEVIYDIFDRTQEILNDRLEHELTRFLRGEF